MMETGIEDSSLLNFHIKKLQDQDLVERREGLYCLTEEGLRVLEILRSLDRPRKQERRDLTQSPPRGGSTRERPCPDCGRKIDVLANVCPYCHARQERMVVSSLWYLVPVFLLWVGGLVAWFVNKDIDPRRARKMLVFGLVWTVILVLFAPFLLSILGLQ